MKEVGQMSEDKKPDWFELVDGDAPSAQVTKINKKLPAIAILAAGTVVALGSFFSSATETDAQAISSNTASSSAPTQVTTSSAPVATEPTPQNPKKAIAAINNPSQGGVQAPGLGSDNDDDDDEDEHERRGHDDDDDDDDERHGDDDDDERH